MRKAATGANALNASFWVLSVLLLGVMFVVPFLQIDRNFNVTPSLSLTKVIATWDASLLAALWNSVELSVIASVFAVVCGGLLGRFIERRPVWLFSLMIAVYAINPVARALSYFDLLQLYTPIADWTTALLGRRFAMSIFLPALILGMHYLPIYLMRNLFVLKKRNTAHDLPPFLEALFDDVPVWIRGFPISFALFFLLTFFDYWVIQVVSGNTVLYWTPLFIQKAFQARAVSEASLMITIGLVATFAAYLAALIASSILLALHRLLRPLQFAGFRGTSRIGSACTEALAWLALLFVSWPLLGTIIKLIRTFTAGETFSLIPDVWHSIIVMLVLGILVGAISATVGLLLSALYEERPRKLGWWMPALYFLALVPEAAYVLFSLFVTGAGLLKGNPVWLFVLMASFSIPMSFFLYQSLWGSMEKQKLWMIGAAMGRRPLQGISIALKEWRRPWVIVFIVTFWLTIDNVFITDFSAGPSWKTLSAVIFNATKRGFSAGEFLSGVVGSLCVLTVIGITLLAAKKKSDAVQGEKW